MKIAMGLLAILMIGLPSLSMGESNTDPYGVLARHSRQESQEIQDQNDRIERMVIARAIAKATRVGRSAPVRSSIVVVKCPSSLRDHVRPSVNPPTCIELTLQNGLNCWAHAVDETRLYPEDVEAICNR